MWLKQKRVFNQKITFYQRIARIIFKICFSRSCSPSRATKHILEILPARRHTLVAQNHQVSIKLHHCMTILLVFFAQHLCSFSRNNLFWHWKICSQPWKVIEIRQMILNDPKFNIKKSLDTLYWVGHGWYIVCSP